MIRMRIQALRNKHKGADIYVVGTGPSMRFFPCDFLKDKITLGLNQAWRYGAMTYSITVHPELVVDYLATKQTHKTQWIIKKKPPMAQLEFDDPTHYVFKTEQDNYNLLTEALDDTLFLGRGVQQTAMHMAMLMGAKNIFLVGVDMTDLAGEHHGHDQHVKFHGLAPADVYAEYRHVTAKVRNILLQKGIHTFTVSPFIGAVHGEEDYKRLLALLKLPPLPQPKDTSTYLRKGSRK